MWLYLFIGKPRKEKHQKTGSYAGYGIHYWHFRMWFRLFVDWSKCFFITAIVNEYLTSGEFPSALKRSFIRPGLKKPDLNKDVLKNYQPVANIPFLAKVIEKVVTLSTHSYLEDNLLMPSMQSAYRKLHLTETALLQVMNDVLRTVDLFVGATLF